LEERKHATQWFSTFNETRRGKRVYPAATAVINALPVSAIDTGLVRKVLEPIWYETPETASRVRGRIERVLAWATVAGYRSGDNPARWTGHLKELLPSKTKVAAVVHHDAVPYRDLPTFMAALREKHGTAARALEFTILSAARTSEALGARWSEIDLDAKVWIIPAERMKANREHRVPLTDRALAVLEPLPRKGEYVFAGARKGKPLSSPAMWDVVRGMLGMGATVHGFRSTFRDWAAETTAYPNEMLEIALAHAIGNKAEAAYRRGDMMEKRRRLMADWAEYCARPPARSRDNIVSIGAGRG
jgi:integrase